MIRIALLGWVLLGSGAMGSAARGQVPVEPPSDPAGAATSAPLPESMPPPPPATKMPVGPARISGGVMATIRTAFVPPVYPEEARSAKLSGGVVLHVLVAKDGTVEKAQVMSATNHVFDQAALDAVKQWRYKPYLLNGQPTEVETSVVVNFSLKH